jgi:beta-N-acetylhexosaminidase
MGQKIPGRLAGLDVNLSTMSTAKEALSVLGELFITGVPGVELAPTTADFLKQAGIGGVIYFGPNYESPAQIAEFSEQIQACRGNLPLWICVDQEGGRVQRFKKPFTRLPEAMAVGSVDSPKLAFELAEIMGRELRAVGVNVDFAPVADIHTNPKNPVIGHRAYGTTEEQVTKMVSAVLRGLLVSGVQPCVKHFPGHGDTSTDSHFSLPRIDASLDSLREREFKPFIKAMKSRCSWIMTAHIVVPSVDPERPATLSPRFLQDILREELRYQQLIVSDDMEMKAIADHFGVDDAPVLAIEAGCDLLIYRSEAGTRRAYQALENALKEGRLSPQRVLDSAARSRALKAEVLMPYEPVVVTDVSSRIGLPEHQALVDRIPALKP